MQIHQPGSWKRPTGYSNGISAEGRLVFVAGQVGWNADEVFEALDLVGQTRQALRSIAAVLAEAGATTAHIVRLTWYITDRHEYLASTRELGRVYREVMGNHYPTMSLVQVAGLVETNAKVEIEATAVIPFHKPTRMDT